MEPPGRVNAGERLILALDLPSIGAAMELVQALDGVVSFYKIGLTLQLAAGKPVLSELLARGNRVFLDYKYFDVPETIKTAVTRAAELGVTFLTIHGSGNIIQAAVAGRGGAPLKLLAVTVLTSLDAQDIRELGYECAVEELVLLRARRALAAGCDGVVASGLEAPAIRRLEAEAVTPVARDRLLIVTPGIRPAGALTQDQKRVATPGEAIAAGADYLVVGRPITGSGDPRSAAQAIVCEMQAAFDQRTPR